MLREENYWCVYFDSSKPTQLRQIKFGEKNEDVEIKGPDICGLATTNVLNTKVGEVENKNPDVTDLVKRTDYYMKIKEIERKYFTTSDYNKFVFDIIDAKTKKFVIEYNKSHLVKKSDLNKIIESLAAKARFWW